MTSMRERVEGEYSRVYSAAYEEARRYIHERGTCKCTIVTPPWKDAINGNPAKFFLGGTCREKGNE
jgi:hypothetical protein